MIIYLNNIILSINKKNKEKKIEKLQKNYPNMKKKIILRLIELFKNTS